MIYTRSIPSTIQYDSGLFPHKRNLFNQIDEWFSIPARFNSILQEEYQRQLSKVQQSTPRYEIREDDSKMELIMDVPGIRSSDIDIQLVQGGKSLKVKGTRYYGEDKENGSKFEHFFTIDHRIVDVDKLEARLADGVLHISVPKIQQVSPEEESRTIPIIMEEVGGEHHDIK